MISKQEKVLTFYVKNGPIDDINDFMPVWISTICDDGTCLGVLNAGDICDYIDKSGISSNPNLNFLKSISPDDNPVVVFMEN